MKSLEIMDTLKKSPVLFNLHEVVAMRDSFTLEWGNGEEPDFDKESYNNAVIEALEDDVRLLAPLFKSLGISLEVLSAHPDFDKDNAFISLGNLDDRIDYGCLLITETCFEWRKKGFSPITLNNFKHIERFCKFLNPKNRFNWLETIAMDESYATGVNRSDYPKHIANPFYDGFVYPASYHNGLRYYAIGSYDNL